MSGCIGTGADAGSAVPRHSDSGWSQGFALGQPTSQRFSTTAETRPLAAHGMQGPLDTSGIARGNSKVGSGRLIGLRPALLPIPQSSRRNSESCGKFLLGQREGAATFGNASLSDVVL
jgi:hypothetical protein